MKILKYILVCMIAMAWGCDRSDEADFEVAIPEGPTFDVTTSYGKRMKEFYDKYGVWCQYNVPALDLYYRWTEGDNWTSSSMDYEYEEADPDYIVKVIDFLESEVMVNFPDEVIKDYLNLCIAFEGRIFHTGEVEDYLSYSSIEDYEGLTLEYEDADYGWNASRYLLLAPVGPEFDKTDKNLLKRKWTTKIFSKVMENLPNPDAFEQNNQDAWNAYYYFYDTYLVGDHEDGWVFNKYLGKYQGPYTDGLVSAGPFGGAILSDGYDDEDAQTGFYALVDKMYNASTCLDAFAEFVGYIMYASAAEKAEIRTQSDKIVENEQLVKEYCKQYLDWDLPELGE